MCHWKEIIRLAKIIFRIYLKPVHAMHVKSIKATAIIRNQFRHYDHHEKININNTCDNLRVLIDAIKLKKNIKKVPF